MKNLSEIEDKIYIDNLLSRNKDLIFIKDDYEHYCKLSNVCKSLLVKPFIEYKINFEFIDKVFAELHNINTLCTVKEIENRFVEIESKLIIFRDLLFTFDSLFLTHKKSGNFLKSEKVSIFKFLTPETLNFKYITEYDLKFLKDRLYDFSFSIIGITEYWQYCFLYFVDDNRYLLYPQAQDKKNLLLIERALRCNIDGINLLISSKKINYEKFNKYSRTN